MSICGQSIALMHSVPQRGASAAHRPSALHMKATSAAMPQFMPVHAGLQGAPHSRPEQGSLPPQPGQLVEQRPMRHSAFGHDEVPSAHIWHGAAIIAHSALVMHCVSHVGYVDWQRPIKQSTLGHLTVPSAQIWHGASICAQSIAVSHSF
jgi:hypothetical protein